ncbi:MAG: extracellular solute-binding protein, partial [Oscillospiraceae bacterium]
MKRFLKIVVSVVLILAFSCGFLGCEKKKETAMPESTIKIMLRGAEPKGFSQVLAEFYKRTEKTLNIKLDIDWVTSNSYKEKLILKMTSGEQYDLVFDAPFVNYKSFINSGAYLPLDEYFENEKYKGLKSAFSDDYLKANMIKNHIYGIPLATDFNQMTLEGVILRGDIREKYKLPVIKTREDLQKYYDTILQNEPNLVPLAVGDTRGLYHLLDSDKEIYAHKSHVYKFMLGMPCTVAISEDNKKILGLVFDGDPASEFASLPAPYNTPDYEKSILGKEWAKYLEHDSINQKYPNSLLIGNKSASILGMIDEFDSIERELKKNCPEAWLEYFPGFKPTQNFEKNGFSSTFSAWNYICIPKNARNPEKAIEFMNWLFESRDNHDLFEYGIEGKDWEKVGDTGFKYPKDHNFSEMYYLSPYLLTANPTMTRKYVDAPEWVTKYNEYAT